MSLQALKFLEVPERLRKGSQGCDWSPGQRFATARQGWKMPSVYNSKSERENVHLSLSPPFSALLDDQVPLLHFCIHSFFNHTKHNHVLHCRLPRLAFPCPMFVFVSQDIRIATDVVTTAALAGACVRKYTIQEGDICDSISSARNVST